MLSKTEREKVIRAVQQNDLQTVKYFIEEKDHPKLFDYDEGQILVHIAAKYGNLEVVKYMMEKPNFSKLHEGTSNSTTIVKILDHTLTILDEAIFAGSIDLVKYLVEKSNVNLSQSKDCERVLFTTIAFNRLNILKYFIEERNVDVKAPCKWLSEPLVFVAVRYKHRDMIQYLIEEKKVDLKERNYLEDNILYPAAEVGDLTFIRHLLDERKMEFDINWTNELGITVLYSAVAFNQMDVIKFLVEEKQADVNIPTYKQFNTTCLHKAISNNNYNVSEFLIDNGAKVEDKDTYGRIKDSKLIELLAMANESMIFSELRKRRSVDLYYSRDIFWSSIIRRNNESAQLDATYQNTTNDWPETIFLSRVCHNQFHSFLLIFEFIIRGIKTYSGVKSKLEGILSPRRILENKIDPIAEDTIQNYYIFMKP